MRPTICVSLVAVGLRPFSRSTWPVAATANGEIITASTTVASNTERVRGEFFLDMQLATRPSRTRSGAMSERGRYARRVSYTIKNLRDVEDSAPKFGFESTQEAHFAQADLEAQDTGCSFHVVKPGRRQGFAHRHEAAEEVYVVVSGSGRIKLDDEIA